MASRSWSWSCSTASHSTHTIEKTGPLALGEVARIMTPVVSAVGAAHSLGIIHRDLKPENIFLAHAPDGGRLPKVLDFGIAKVLDPNQINELATKSGATRTGSMLGTPHYMSIEQACGEKDIDHRTDVWSMGIILYNMLSGRRPYDGENYGQILRALMTTTPPPNRVTRARVARGRRGHGEPLYGTLARRAPSGPARGVRSVGALHARHDGAGAVFGCGVVVLARGDGFGRHVAGGERVRIAAWRAAPCASQGPNVQGSSLPWPQPFC